MATATGDDGEEGEEMARGGGLLVQGTAGQRGNFEVVIPRVGGGFWQFWRNNDTPPFPWHGPGLGMGSESDVSDVALVHDSLFPWQFSTVRREASQLMHSIRTNIHVQGQIRPRWGASEKLPGGAIASGGVGFVQSSAHGHFEVVAPLHSGGMAHWWRDNGSVPPVWHGPIHVAAGAFSHAALIESDVGHLEVIAVAGSHVAHFWRDPSLVWHGPIAIPGGGVSGQPGFVQAQDGTFHVVAPLAGGGMGHWRRETADQWSGPVAVGSGTVHIVGLIQSNFGAGNLEVVARTGAGLDHYHAEPAAGGWTWHGPEAAWREPALDPVAHGRCLVGFKPPGPSAIHVATLPNGDAVCLGFGDGGMGADPGAFMINPATGAIASPATKHHLFCAGHALLPDGQLLIAGGHGDEVNATHLFNPASVGIQRTDDMTRGRWYPTVTVLADGRAAIMSGSQKTGPISAHNPVNGTVQLFDAAKPPGHRLSAEEHLPSPFSPHFPAGHQDIDLYPWNFALPDGRMLVHSRNSTRFWHPGTPGRWDPEILKAQRNESRTYPGQGTCVLLPLLPEENHRVRVMAIGGGGVDREVFYQGAHDDDIATNTAELLDLGAPNPAWRFVAPMHHPRVLCDSVLLPTGKILVVGGSSTGKSDVGVDPVLPTELYDPASDTWTELAPINCPHMYHSTAVLLPDGRVMRGGKDGQFQRNPYKYFEHRLELFSMPYLFRGARPTISSAPAAAHYGQDMTIRCPAPGDITTVALIRCGAVTHSFHMDQRHVGLHILGRTATALTVKLPPHGHVAPPGSYMLFLVNSEGAPSVAHIMKIS